MKRRHHTPEYIVRKLREVNRLLGEGSSMVVVCKNLEVMEQRYHWWRNQYCRMKAYNAKELMARIAVGFCAKNSAFYTPLGILFEHF